MQTPTFGPMLKEWRTARRVRFRFFSTITTFATPQDVTLDEIRIECCFPDNEQTAELCRRLAASDRGQGPLPPGNE